jgi:hypothetical protein
MPYRMIPEDLVHDDIHPLIGPSNTESRVHCSASGAPVSAHFASANTSLVFPSVTHSARLHSRPDHAFAIFTGIKLNAEAEPPGCTSIEQNSSHALPKFEFSREWPPFSVFHTIYSSSFRSISVLSICFPQQTHLVDHWYPNVGQLRRVLSISVMMDPKSP